MVGLVILSISVVCLSISSAVFGYNLRNYYNEENNFSNNFSGSNNSYKL